MEKFKCIAVDDDLVALKIITSLINKSEFLELIGTYSDAIEGANAMSKLKPDIVFLDIQMPGLSGMDIVRNLDDRPEVILVTSQDKFAVEAFEFDVTDYLIKPVENYARFLKAVNKASDNILQKRNSSNSKSLFVKVDSLLVNLDIDSILYAEAYGDYVKIHTDTKTHVVYSKFKNVEEKLLPNNFVRVHRSFIVQLDKIRNIDQGNLQVGDKIIPVSNSYKAALLEKIKTL